jgi:hypothetical protein
MKMRLAAFVRWICRLLRADDVRGAVSLYGGRMKPIRGPEFCTK